MDQFLTVLFCVLGIILALYITACNVSSPRHIDFLICALLVGTFLHGAIMPYYDDHTSIFGAIAFVVILTGGIVGGVGGVLLPKISGGLSLGVISSLFFCGCLELVNPNLSDRTSLIVALSVFGVSISIGILLVYSYEKVAVTIRTAIASGLLATMVLSTYLGHTFVDIAYDTLTLKAVDKPSQIFKLELFSWSLISIVSFLVQSDLNGDLKRWRQGTYQVLQSSPSIDGRGRMKASEQKTFSYPDALEFNYFDPDSLPRHLQAHADIIFSTVQSLASEFGFQVDSSRNQAEHLLMMLSNECRAGEHILTEPPNRLHSKLFSNYKKWCDRVGSAPAFCKAMVGKSYNAQIEDTMLFLLIWGEAGNLRHMPECICFLFHKTMLTHLSTIRYNEHLYPGYFLDHVITPIYEVVAVALKSNGDHETKKCYDDMNEFFWSPSCLKYDIEHSLKETESQLDTTSESSSNILLAQAMANSTKSYVEKRSYFHAILSFHRVFEWHAIVFTLLVFYGFSTTLVWSTEFYFQTCSVVFIEINLFRIFWLCLEVWSTYPSSFMSVVSKGSYLLRLVIYFTLLVYQVLYYYRSFNKENGGPSLSDGSMHSGQNSYWWWQFVWLSLISCALYIIESVICWFPSISSAVMCWNNDMVQSILNILYPFSSLYVGKRMDLPQAKVFGYIFFWITLLAWKIYFGYVFITYPMTKPTILMYDQYMNYENQSFVKLLVLLSIQWIPHFLVFLIDLSIWYSVWSAMVGAYSALTTRQGAVRDMLGLREHFMRAPHAFCQRIMPPTSSVGVLASKNSPSQSDVTVIDTATSVKKKLAPPPTTMKLGKKGMSSNDLLSYQNSSGSGNGGGGSSSDETKSMQERIEGTDGRLTEYLDVRTQRWVAFAKVWNGMLNNLRNSDHLSDSELESYEFNKYEWASKPIYLPSFQTVALVERSVQGLILSSIAYHNEKVPEKKLLIWEKFIGSMSVTAQEGVSEAWELTTWSLEKLLGRMHAGDIIHIFQSMEKWSTSDDLYSKFDPSLVPSIINQISNITSTLKGCIIKRRKNPLVTEERRSGGAVVGHGSVSRTSSDGSGGGGGGGGSGSMKRSVSSGFLKSIANQQHHDQPEAATAPKIRFAKLEPFRKNFVLHDNVRDKIRDELRNLLNTLRTALKDKVALSAEAKDLVDRITFMLSMENGFLWDDVYASSHIDEFVREPDALTVSSKLYSLLKCRQTEVELSGSEAKRRILFFINSLFMDMPTAPSLRYSKEYSIITPFYSEDVLLTKDDLLQKNEDGVTTLLYLKTLYKKDWLNFLERTNIQDDESIWVPKNIMETRIWASLRAQTLYRTVDGMMQSEAAVRILGELEQISAPDVDLYAKLKFSYVVACQVYGQMKKQLEHKAADLEFLLNKYPNLRMAYIDNLRVNRLGEMAYYSVLVKGDVSTFGLTKNCKVKEVFRVKLPGNPVLGEGKPENQNHALIFTRGRYLQAIDMNQDGYFEEAFKMRNLLEEFDDGCAIIGFREHIFTGSVSSVANYMALQELSFVTLGQRVLASPLNIRQHYGHPDFFDKMFVITEGGMSKASRGINLSEDVFSGFNATIRGHTVGFKEYVQVGKGRDVGLQQTYKFEAKLAQGNAEQSLSRDMYRICERLDFYRLLSFYYGGVGHYVANAMIMFTLITVVYFMLGLAVFDQEGINGQPLAPEGPLQLALAGMGLLQTMPLVMTLVVEKGIGLAVREIGFMFLSGGPLYFIFQIQTKSYYFQQTILAGGASYKATGRGFVTRHSPFDENYRYFATSHLYLGFELMIALLLYKNHTTSHQYLGLTWSLWLVTISFLAGPFWFNPLSFETSKVVEDYTKWSRWMGEVGGSGDQSWESWYKEENKWINNLSISWKIFLFCTRCIIWTVIGIGITGPGFFEDETQEYKFSFVFIVVAIFLGGNWLISKLEFRVSYATRRFASLILSAICFVLLIYLFHAHKKYFIYSISCYYFGASIAFLSLLSGLGNPSRLYKFHDMILGHFLFTFLYLLSIICVGVLQTWLLYHNALSSGVAIQDILKYAVRKKESSIDQESVVELRQQVADQERTIRQLLQTVQTDHIELNEHSSLLPKERSSISSSTTSGGEAYGSIQIKPFGEISKKAGEPQQALAGGGGTFVKSAMKVKASDMPPPPPSKVRVTTKSSSNSSSSDVEVAAAIEDTDVGTISILGAGGGGEGGEESPSRNKEGGKQQQKNKNEGSAGGSSVLRSPTPAGVEGGGDFLFKQPTSFPKRDEQI